MNKENDLKITIPPPLDFNKLKVKAYDYDTKEEEILTWEEASELALSAKRLDTMCYLLEFGWAYLGQYGLTLLDS